jgi:O-antigen/teichoic acid export membrane protein
MHLRLGSAIRGSIGVYVVGALLVLLTQLVLARTLGAADYGVYYYALSLLVIVSLVCQSGLDQALLRFMPQYAQSSDWSHAKGILLFGNRYIFASSTIVASIVIVTVFLLEDRLSISQRNTLLVAALCLPLRGLIYLRQATLRSFMHTVKSLLPDAVIMPIVLIALIAGTIQSGYPVTAPRVMLATLAAIAISFLVGAYWQSKLMPQEIRAAKPLFNIKGWLTVSFMLLMINGSHLFIGNIDLIILGFYRETSEIGIYGISSRIATTVTFLLIATYPVLAPVIAKHRNSDDPDDLQNAITRIMRPLSCLAVAFAAALLATGESILGFFGDDFKAGVNVLYILVCGQVVNALCGPVALLLAYRGHEALVAKVLFVTMLFAICLNILLIPRYGMIGAAIANSIPVIFWNLTLYGFCRHRLNTDASGLFPKFINR